MKSSVTFRRDGGDVTMVSLAASRCQSYDGVMKVILHAFLTSRVVSSRGSPEHVQTIRVLWLFQAKSSVLRTWVVCQCCQYAELLGSRSEWKCKMLIRTIKCKVNGSSNKGPARPILSRRVDSVEPQSLHSEPAPSSLSSSALFPLPDSSLCSHRVSFSLLYYKVHAL